MDIRVTHQLVCVYPDFWKRHIYSSQLQVTIELGLITSTKTTTCFTNLCDAITAHKCKVVLTSIDFGEYRRVLILGYILKIKNDTDATSESTWIVQECTKGG